MLVKRPNTLSTSCSHSKLAETSLNGSEESQASGSDSHAANPPYRTVNDKFKNPTPRPMNDQPELPNSSHQPPMLHPTPTTAITTTNPLRILTRIKSLLKSTFRSHSPNRAPATYQHALGLPFPPMSDEELQGKHNHVETLLSSRHSSRSTQNNDEGHDEGLLLIEDEEDVLGKGVGRKRRLETIHEGMELSVKR